VSQVVALARCERDFDFLAFWFLFFSLGFAKGRSETG
jgi:hypothetical protein